MPPYLKLCDNTNNRLNHAVKKGTRKRTSVTYVNLFIHSLPADVAFDRNITVFPVEAVQNCEH